MRAKQLRKRPKHLHNFTGLEVEQFDALCKAVSEAYQHEQIDSVKPRLRAVGGGRKAQLNIEDQVLVILMYYRLYITQVLLGYLFELDDSNVSRLITRLRPVLLEVLPLPAQETLLFTESKVENDRPKQRRISSLSELLKKHPELKEVLVDATEQEIQKPKDKAKRKGNYSGKKKRHTLKTQVTTDACGLLLHVTKSVPGRLNDLNLLRGTGLLRDLPADISVRVDKGYDGVQNDFPDRHFHQPYKARRNKPLDFIQKCFNQLENRLRVKVENVLAHLKRYKLLAHIYRGPLDTYDDTFLAISGLHNFRKLDSLSW